VTADLEDGMAREARRWPQGKATTDGFNNKLTGTVLRAPLDSRGRSAGSC